MKIKELTLRGLSGAMIICSEYRVLLSSQDPTLYSKRQDLQHMDAVDIHHRKALGLTLGDSFKVMQHLQKNEKMHPSDTPYGLWYLTMLLLPPKDKTLLNMKADYGILKANGLLSSGSKTPQGALWYDRIVTRMLRRAKRIVNFEVDRLRYDVTYYQTSDERRTTNNS